MGDVSKKVIPLPWAYVDDKYRCAVCKDAWIHCDCTAWKHGSHNPQVPYLQHVMAYVQHVMAFPRIAHAKAFIWI